RGISEYYLIKVEKISAHTLHRMKLGEPITTKTIDKLCEILECNVEDVIKHELDEY
ncbi:TPA: helix-turn-helix domain-containing protein, partial [Streptococcus suis]